MVAESVGRGPVNIVIDGLDPASVESLRIDKTFITVNGTLYNFDHRLIFHSCLPEGTVDNKHLKDNLTVLTDALRKLSSPLSLAFLIDETREIYFTSSFERSFVERIKNGVKTIFNCSGGLMPSPEKIVHGVKMIKGLGFGLTPSGDDFIAGLLVALNLLERIDGIDRARIREKIVSAARGGNILSNSFIALAGEGSVFEGFQNLLNSLLWGNEAELLAATAVLLALGASSGSDMAVGFLLAMKNF